MKDTYVRARVDRVLKDQAEKILNQLGITMSQAIILMLRQTVAEGKLPFRIEGAPVPNARTLAMMKHHDLHPDQVTKHESSAALFESLGIAKTEQP
ncbi:type II toxin-antitoxin system RelB/DinJ family antitoxin [Pseudomonas putida]|nr:type II toxin-antitoxin system RelB/DinJ family antitoxin [Pseudomonas putida]